MKKVFALLLALTMVFSLGFACAEDAEKTTIFYDEGLSFAMLFPDGYTATATVEDGIMLITVVSEDEQAPNFLMVIAPDEEYDEVERLNDLSDEEIAAFASDMMEDMNDPYYEVAETGLGSKLIVINEQNAEMDYVILASVYHGYLLYTYIGHNDGSEVTQDDIQMGIQIYTDMDFVTK